MDNTIYIVLGVVFAIYLVITITNKRKNKERKSRKFMGDYKRKGKEDWSYPLALFKHYWISNNIL